MNQEKYKTRKDIHEEIFRKELKIAQPIQNQLLSKFDKVGDLTSLEMERARAFVEESSIVGFHKTKSKASICSDGGIAITIAKYDDSKFVEIHFAPEELIINYLDQEFKIQKTKELKHWRNEVFEMMKWLGFTFYR